MTIAPLLSMLQWLWYIPRGVAISALELYQKTLSPDHGPLKHLHTYGYCRHSPTCSTFAKEMLMEKGFLIGSVLSAKRLLSCHPWAPLSEARLVEVLERTH